MSELLLEAVGISKRYAHVIALADVSVAVHAGEVVAIVGDNGAGKSTLVKILSGAVRPDSGAISVRGKAVSFGSPADAHAAGIETLYQDLALAPDLDAASNMFLGREIRARGIRGRIGMLDRPRMRREAQEMLGRLGSKLQAGHVPIAALSGGQQQIVAAGRASMWARDIIFMDEPTAALGVKQTGEIRDLIERLVGQGLAVVLVSHNMPQVLELSDRIEVLQLGRNAATFHRGAVSTEQLVAAMTGSLSTTTHSTETSSLTDGSMHTGGAA